MHDKNIRKARIDQWKIPIALLAAQDRVLHKTNHVVPPRRDINDRSTYDEDMSLARFMQRFCKERDD